MTSALLALEALLMHIDDGSTPHLSWRELSKHVRAAECRLLAVKSVREIFTAKTLVALLEYPQTIPCVIALFRRAFVDGTITVLEHEKALAKHLFRSRGPKARASLLAPTPEYLDTLGAVALSARCLVIASRTRIQSCRLMLALSLHHPLALEWIKIVEAMKTSYPWWVTLDWRDGVAALKDETMAAFILIAALRGYDEFVALALERFPNVGNSFSFAHLLTREQLLKPSIYELPCPFACSRRCCASFTFSTEERAHARSILPVSYHQRVSFIGH